MEKFENIIKEIPIEKNEYTSIESVMSDDANRYQYDIDIERFLKVVNDIPITTSRSKTNTIARVFNRSRDENFITDWFGYLIETNAEVLNELLLFMGFEIDLVNCEYTVTREFTFSNNRRIDILIESESFVVGIENKIDAGFQSNQLNDYSRSIKNYAKGKDVLLVLLAPQDRNGLVASHEFVKITYDDLHAIMANVKTDFIEDLRGSFYLKDFMKHMEEHFMASNSSFIYNEWTKFLGKYHKEVKIITDSAKKERVNILEYIQQEMLEVVNDEEWECSKIGLSQKFIQLYKKSWKQDIDIHFELFQKDNEVIPCRFVIRVDIEGKGTALEKDEIAKKIGTKQRICEVTDVYEIDYESEETFNVSVSQLIKSLEEVVRKYTPLINDYYKSI